MSADPHPDDQTKPTVTPGAQTPSTPSRSDEITHATVAASNDATRATAVPKDTSTQPTIVTGGTNSGANAATRATIVAGSNDVTRPSSAGDGLSTSSATHLDVAGNRGLAKAAGSHHGETWGDFELGPLLGRGGMGAVYSGRQISLDRPVAIKVLSEHLTHSNDFRKRFLLEARAAARINSPHVVQVYFAGEFGNNHYFAMEFVEGTDLSRKLKDGWKPNSRESLDLVIQAARSLVALSEHKIVHRDIKPANFMFTVSGRLKLMDFGLVKFASEAHGLTQTGTVMGTVNYFSPEQGRGESCDQRTDIYALGVMFYELLTGKLPFSGGDATSVIYQHIHVTPKPPQEINPAVSEPYQSVVLRCLEKEAADRYPNAAELLADLERIERGMQPMTATFTARRRRPIAGAATTTASAAVPGRRWVIPVAVVAGALAIAAAIIFRPVPVTANVPPLVIAAKPTTPEPTPQANPTVTELVATPAPPAVPPTIVKSSPVPAPKPEPIAKPEPPPTPAVVVQPHKPETPPVVVVKPEPVAVVAPSPKPETSIIAPAVASVGVKIDPPPAPKPESPPVAIIVPPKPDPVPEPAPITKPEPPPVVKPEPPPIAKPALPPVKPAPPAKPVPPAIQALTAPVEATIRVPIPVGDPLLKAPGFVWWLEGPPGRSGHLDARSTTTGEILWTAPAIPGDTVLHVAGVDGARQLMLPLRATPLTQPLQTRSLQPFARLTAVDERRIGRLTRDRDGSWWALSSDEAVITRITGGWSASMRFISPTPPAKPLAIVSHSGSLYVLDGGQPAVRIYGADGTQQKIIAGFQRPTDLVVGTDGLIYVADQRAGGVLVLDADGKRVATLARTSPGASGFERLTRICVGADKTLYALDADARAVVVFQGSQLPLATWALDRSDRPVGIAIRGDRVLVLIETGEVRVFTPQGQVERTIPSASTSPLAESLGPASDLALDIAGDLYVCYPESEQLARHLNGGKDIALRSGRAWTRRSMSVDSAGRLYALDSDHLRVDCFDAEGWRLRSLGGPLKKGGSFVAPLTLAVAPEGQALAVIDEDTRQVTRFDAISGAHVTFGGRGTGDGQFTTPVAVSMDQAGRTYVLDTEQHRISVFDLNGGFLFKFGRYERGDQSDMLRTPRQFAVSLAGDAAYVSDDESLLIKKFALDHTNRRVTHVGNFGGKGQGLGQFLRVTGMGCDGLGLLYVVDYKRSDLQVIDWSAAAPTVVHTFVGNLVGIRRMQNLAVGSSGLCFIFGDGTVNGIRW